MVCTGLGEERIQREYFEGKQNLIPFLSLKG